MTLRRGLHWRAGEPPQRVTAPYPHTAQLFLEVSGASCTSAWCWPPGIPAEDGTKHPARRIKYLKYLRPKTLACYRSSGIPVRSGTCHPLVTG